MLPIPILLGLTVFGAYLVAAFGPKPAPAVLAPGQQTALPPDQAAKLDQAAMAAQLVMGGSGLAPGYQGQPVGATVSGILVWRGETTPEGARIVYDARGVPHYVIG